MMDFISAFHTLTSQTPFPWQERLYREYFANGQVPSACCLPTGLGKTSVVAVWLIALAYGKDVLRWLIYVVNQEWFNNLARPSLNKSSEGYTMMNFNDNMAAKIFRSGATS